MQLKNGDILVFKADEHWISKAIALLTNSDVSHSAMMYSEGQLVEMGLSGIGVNRVTVETEGRKTYVMRLDPGNSTNPLLEAAKVYIDADTVYNIPALAMIGGIVIYRYIRPTPKYVHVIDLVIRAACIAVNKLIEEIRGTGKTMTCSQLVYQIYFDCGKDYYIKLIDPLVKKNADMADGLICFADMIEDIEVPLEQVEFDNELEELHDDPEELAHQLYLAAIEAQEVEVDMLASPASINKAAKSAKKLLDLLEELLAQCDSKLPLNSLFVAPSDLLKAKNLKQAGIVNTKVKS